MNLLEASRALLRILERIKNNQEHSGKVLSFLALSRQVVRTCSVTIIEGAELDFSIKYR